MNPTNTPSTPPLHDTDDQRVDKLFDKEYLCGVMPDGTNDEEEVYASISDVLNDNFDEDVAKDLKSAILSLLAEARIDELKRRYLFNPNDTSLEFDALLDKHGNYDAARIAALLPKESK